MSQILMPIAVVLAAALCAAQGKPEMTPGQREAELFKLLDLDHPGLRAVKAAEDAGDREAATQALAEYCRLRQQPKWPVDPARRPKAPVPNANTSAADRVLRREFVGMGRVAKLDHIVDWDANPLGDVEWTVDLNQHGYWRYLGRAYWQTHDEKYAKDFALQLRGWLEAYPRLDWRPHRRCVWRSTLRAAVRMGGVWRDAFCYFADSPNFTVQDRVCMLHSVAQHADYLLNSRSGGNWLLAEASALFHVGVMFPEFKDAAAWRAAGIERLYREMNVQVYPDGAQAELTPHYHGACMGSLLRPATLAKAVGAAIPGDYLARMEKMFDYCLYLAKPDLRIPMLNDSDYDSVQGWMRRGAELFDRPDMKYRATEGRAGEAPKHTSYAFPYAGFYVMRSGWDRDALYMLFEAGPFGLGHQHEDKLQIDVYAYGRPLLLDPGRYTYVPNEWRRYFVGTQSHNTVVVDGHGQQRRGTDRSLWVVDCANDNRWVSNGLFDLAMGSYTDGYGPGIGVVHVRRVLFVKDDYWVVSDRLYAAKPEEAHEFASQFQFSATGVTVDEKTQAAQSHNDDVNLLIVPASPGKFRVDVVEGQTDPPRGWIGWNYHRDLKTPASMVAYRWKGACPASADMVLYPYRGTKAPPLTVRALGPHGVAATALEIRHEKGIDRVLMQHCPAQSVSLGQAQTDAEAALLRCDAAGKLVASAAVHGSYVVCGAQPPSAGVPQSGATVLHTLHTQPRAAVLRVTVVDEHKAKVSWSCREPVRVMVRYGHEVGGGYLFEKAGPIVAARQGEVTLAYLTTGLHYVFRAEAVTDDGWQALLGEGRFATAPPAEFDFEADGLANWGPRGSVRRVAGGVEPGRFCLEATQAPSAGVKYVTAMRSVLWTVTPKSRVAFDYRTAVEHPGKSYYFKINCADSLGEDWSVYVEREPAGQWRHVDLALTSLREDSSGHRNRTRTLPPGTEIKVLRFTQRKGQAAEASAPAFMVDNVKLYEGQ